MTFTRRPPKGIGGSNRAPTIKLPLDPSWTGGVAAACPSWPGTSVLRRAPTYLTDYGSDQWPNSQFPILIRADQHISAVCSDENWELRIGPLVRSVWALVQTLVRQV